MPNCPHCEAELPIETLSSEGESICPRCGQPIDKTDADWDLSSLAGGSPADATLPTGGVSDSSLAGSSLAGSDSESLEPLPEDSSSDVTIDSAGLSDFELTDDPEPEATLAYGHRTSGEEDDDFDFDDDEDDEQGFLLDDEEEAEGPSESLDATIDFGRLAGKPASEPASDATIDLAGPAAGGLARDLTGADQGDSAGELTTDSSQPDRPEATLPADSDQPPSGLAGSGGGSSFSDTSLERTDSPSSSADDATLQFDSERRSSEVDTPEAIDITGLGSEDTLPRGQLAGGRASASLRPGDSMIVGDESVRLRAFELSEAQPGGAKQIDYAIEGEAGKGGMGVVYKARQQSLDRLVAIKQIKSEMGASDSDRNKFVSEAVITGQLEHPNIAPVHDLGLAADGLPFYAMKFVEGEDWEDSIKEKSEEDNLTILIQVAQAIAFAHSKNILHRDLKPGNVRLGSFGEVLVMDWGLAARLDEGAEIQPAGTPIYMPPETALEYLDYAKGKMLGGKRVGSSRRRFPAGTYCDIYLLGALLFKIVTGRAPHRGKTTFECLRAAAKNDIIKVRRSSELLDIAYKAMATDPEDRHATALDFIEAIRAYQSHAQSILIAKRASKDLRQAGRLVDSKSPETTELYALFSSAQYGYQNALDLWDGNRKAARRLRKSQRMFAKAAYGNGDYDLALSMLDGSSDEDAGLRRSIASSQKSRNARVAWFRTLQYATAASLVLALSFIAYSVVARLDAISARKDAVAAQAEAEQGKQAAEAAKREVLSAQQEVEAQQQLAQAERAAAVEAKQQTADANQQRQAALALVSQAEADIADAEQQLAVAKSAQQQAAELARTQSYLAAYSQVRATLSDNGAYAAWKALREIDPAVAALGRGRPEWDRLVRQVDWRAEATELVGEDPAALIRPTLVGTSVGEEWLASLTQSPSEPAELTLYRGPEAVETHRLSLGSGVKQIAIDSSGRFVAFAGERLRVFDRTVGKLLDDRSLAAGVATVAFHPGRAELLVGNKTSAIERWSLTSGMPKQIGSDDRWHRTGITAVGYSPDGLQRFSADASGRVVVWRISGGDTAGEWDQRVTLQHAGAGSPRITAAALSQDTGGRLAYGCDDGSVYERFGWWSDTAALTDGDYAEAASERLDTSHPAAVTGIGYAEAGTTIVSTGGETLLVRRSPTLTSDASAELKTIRAERRYHDAMVLACAVGREGVAYSSDQRGRVLRWQIDAAPRETTLQPAGKAAGVAAVRLTTGQDGTPGAVVADHAGFVRSWSDLAKADDATVDYLGHADHRDLRAWRLAGSPERLVTVAADNRACLWRLEDGLLDRTIELGGRTVVAVDPVQRTLYASADGRPVEGASAMAWSLDSNTQRPMWDRTDRVSVMHALGDAKGRLAVGLRDGQVYLWSPATGREELVRSSGRPHWRAVSALAYDPSRDRLYSGDTGGLLAAWDLAGKSEPIERLLTRKDTAGPGGIARIELASDNRVLVVQRSAERAVPSLLTDGLKPTAAGRLARPGLIDIAFDSDANTLIGLMRRGPNPELAAWDEQQGWRRAMPVNTPSLERLRTATDGWLLWGAGRVEWRPARGADHPLARRIISRPPTDSLIASGGAAATAVTAIGSLDTWSNNQPNQRRLPLDAELLASCPSEQPDQALIAVARGEGASRLELWDTAEATRLRFVAELASRPHRLVPHGGRVLALSESRIDVVSLAGGKNEAVDIEAGLGRPISAALANGGRRLAIATSRGNALLAERAAAGDWRVSRLDREGVTSVAFTPDGDRLLVGVESGRVLMLGLEGIVEGVQTTRPLLSLAGHSNRVTLLRVAESPEGDRIVSGDASGRVVVRSL